MILDIIAPIEPVKQDLIFPLLFFIYLFVSFVTFLILGVQNLKKYRNKNKDNKETKTLIKAIFFLALTIASAYLVFFCGKTLWNEYKVSKFREYDYVNSAE